VGRSPDSPDPLELAEVFLSLVLLGDPLEAMSVEWTIYEKYKLKQFFFNDSRLERILKVWHRYIQLCDDR